MLIKGLEYQKSGRNAKIVFPESKTIILKGSNTLEIIFLIERLLNNDLTNYYVDKDNAEYNINYDSSISGKSQLVFQSGYYLGENEVVTKIGNIPQIHCIRYLHQGKYRSVINTDDENAVRMIYLDTTKFIPQLPITLWNRMIIIVNKLIGEEFVKIESNGNSYKLIFNETNSPNWSLEAKKLAYSLITECHLTPQGYSRILLLPDIDILDKEQELQLLSTLDNIKGHSLTLSNIPDITFKDVGKCPAIKVISV